MANELHINKLGISVPRHVCIVMRRPWSGHRQTHTRGGQQEGDPVRLV